ncbi:MAG: hypothetical protein IAE90_08850 [Ignavibacteria bacterium]|nr:hypothetical protein [Ignavibacteria bacterium]
MCNEEKFPAAHIMKLPFTIEQFLGVFELYNQSVWPFQIFIYIPAVLCIFFIFRNSRLSGKLISAILVFLWLWMGVIYHLTFFTTINPAAYVFGILFITQAVLLAYYGLLKGTLSFAFEGSVSAYAGIAMVAFALIVYPLAGYFFGHIYPRSPTFGLPCPTTIFTLGILLMLKGRIPFRLLIVPILWSLVGFMAALQLGIYEDTGLLISGITALICTILRNNSFQKIRSDRVHQPERNNK